MRMMYRVLTTIIISLALLSTNIYAQQPPALSASATNVSVSTNTLVLPYDASRLHWNVHPEGTTGIRCEPGLFNGTDSSIVPTTTIGEEFAGGGYFDSFPITNPQLSLRCTAETGTVTVSVWQDDK